MWDDVLNKTNQGNGFKGFREELMNIVIEYDEDIEREIQVIGLYEWNQNRRVKFA